MSRRDARLRKAVVARDRTCRMLTGDGTVCGRPAVQANHKRRQRDGGVDSWTNLEGACAEHNARDGAYARRRRPAPRFLTPAQASLVAALDAAGAASDVGRRAALRALAGRLAMPVNRLRSGDVDAACAWRREHARPSLGSRW